MSNIGRAQRKLKIPNIPRLDHFRYDMENEHEEDRRSIEKECSGPDQLCYDNENKNGGGREKRPERKKLNDTCAHHIKYCVVFGASIVISLT